ncbi:hypothetical protein KSB_01820 [Ktedonobacter robiniae]|uniref:Uncharacterized protein n=1 Tax=Ktedonobacter robiniae TaxID=2778365 RepID=A0ABQ3UG75_9CHLR|nr:hypothetical protein KSB_01820 [Ktedonobacter robiniae]
MREQLHIPEECLRAILQEEYGDRRHIRSSSPATRFQRVCVLRGEQRWNPLSAQTYIQIINSAIRFGAR